MHRLFSPWTNLKNSQPDDALNICFILIQWSISVLRRRWSFPWFCYNNNNFIDNHPIKKPLRFLTWGQYSRIWRRPSMKKSWVRILQGTRKVLKAVRSMESNRLHTSRFGMSLPQFYSSISRNIHLESFREWLWPYPILHHSSTHSCWCKHNLANPTSQTRPQVTSLVSTIAS